MKKLGLLLPALLLTVNHLFAQNIVDRDYLTSYTTLASISSDVADDRYSAIASGGSAVNFADKSHFGIVTLGIEEDQNICYSDYVKLTVTGTATGMKYTTPGTVTSFSQVFTLEAEYDPAAGLVFSDKSYIKIADACSLKISVGSITLTTIMGSTPVTVTNPSTSLKADMYIETMLVRERYYKPHASYAGTTFSSITIDNARNTLTLNWTQATVGGLINYPDEYEIEWGYAENYADGTDPSGTVVPSFSFRNNASRIRVKNVQTFELKNIYDRGYLVFRIRGIWKGGPDFDEDIVGQWNTGSLGDITPALCTAFTSSYVPVAPPTNTQSKNWISTLTFADNGLHKPVVQYADGSGRVRQTVTLVTPETGPGDRTSVVTETFYDYRGRAAVSTLPVPALTNVNGIPQNSLQYFNRFNLKDGTTQKYSKEHFDVDGLDTNGDCVPEIPGFSDNVGAGRYYSPSNTIGDYHAYVPDAENFPFTHTVYERDNTGRIRSQSGVGITHATGRGHETVYQYTVPNQAELDRLFGTDVGYASHYKKNIVQDANGQYSVSYLNMSGKTVATSLAGQSPGNVLPLKHDEAGLPMYQTDAETITADLINKDSNHPYGASNPLNDAGNGRNMSYTFSVLQAQDYVFDYQTIGKDYFDACAPDLCADCVYDLKIRLTDRCGNNVLPASLTGGNDYVLRRIGGTLSDTLCNQDSVLHITDTEFKVPLDEGVYTLTKELTVNMEAVEYYAQKFIENNTCLPDLDDFYVAPEDCYPDCETYPEDCEGSGSGDGRNFCKAAYDIMLADMRPGGQYGFVQTEEDGSVDMSNSVDYYLSVYLVPNLLPQRDFTCTSGVNACPPPPTTSLTPAFWRNPKYRNASGVWEDKYYDEDGTEARIPVFLDENDQWSPKVLPGITPAFDATLNQYYVKPQELKNLEDFIAAFSYGGWEKSLVVYHPEYFFYEGCISLEQSTVTIGGETMNTWEYEEFIASVPLPGFQSEFSWFGELREKDPLFQTGTAFETQPFMGLSGFPTYNDIMIGIMNNYTGSGYNMLEMAYATTYCGGSPTLTCIPGGALSTAPDDDVRGVLVSSYIAAKQDLVYYYMSMYSSQRQGDTWCVDGENTGISYLGGNNTANPQNPCDMWKAPLYFEKEKRFIKEAEVSDAHGFGNPPDTEAMKEYADQVYYNETGNCPVARDLELLIRLLHSDNQLVPHTVPFNITDASYLTPLLSDALVSSGATLPISFTSNYSAGTKRLFIGFQGTIACSLSLSFPSGLPYGFPDIVAVQSIGNIQQVGADYTFDLKVVCASGGIQETVTISGTTCIPLTGCQSAFRAVCKVQPVGYSVRKLMNTLAEAGGATLYCPGSCVIPSQLIPFVDAPIKTYIGALAGGGNYTWTWNGSTSPGKWTLYNTTSGVAKGFEVKIISSVNFTPGTVYTWATVQAAVSTTTSPSQSNQLVLKGYEMGNPSLPGSAYPTSITVELVPIGFSQIVATDCALVEGGSTTCNTEAHKNLESLNNLIQSMIAGGQTNLLGTLTDCPLTEVGFADGSSGFSWTNVTAMTYVEAWPEGGSENGVETRWFKATVTYSGTQKQITGKWCKPLRNCVECGVDAPMPCNDQGLSGYLTYEITLGSITQDGVVIQGCFTPGAPTQHTWNGLDQSQLTTIFMYLYQSGDLTDQDVYTHWAAAVNALHIPNVYAFIVNGKLYIRIWEQYLRNPNDPDCNCTAQFTPPNLNIISGGVNTGIPNGTARKRCCTAPPPATTPYVDDEGNPILTETEWPAQDNLVFGQDCSPATEPMDDVPYVDNCNDQLEDQAQLNAQNYLDEYIAAAKAEYIRNYLAKCLEAKETMTMQYLLSEYHFTLYYYDRAGNLVRTVPPHAVEPLAQSDLPTVVSARAAGTALRPTHNTYVTTGTGLDNWSLGTQYAYNSLNAVSTQKTPDGGTTQFWYDNLGRVALSKNAVQTGNTYSYTRYDHQGRITEVGQLLATSAITEATVKNPVSLSTWFSAISAGDFTQITKTFYDVADAGTTPAGFTQQNLRGRVSGTVLIDQGAASPVVASSVHYDYDFHGNVKNLLNVNNALSGLNQHEKTVSYTYDLVSGKVLRVDYNPGQADAFSHRYRYDNENRLLEAETSTDGLFWDLDARYTYYRHGPLARTEYGNKVQGMDYVYTIQGWMKSVNSDALNETYDPGNDGYLATGNPYSWFSRDAFAYSLQYFAGDYLPVQVPAFGSASAGPAVNNAQLYNGNIRSMNVTLKKPNTYDVLPLAQAFAYDQLNRIRSGTAYADLNLTSNTWGGTALTQYATGYTYDPAGNLKTLNRKGDNTSLLDMDEFSYVYEPNSNRLDYIDDNTPSTNYDMDVDDQNTDNYGYDAIGNLIRDDNESITSITWTLYGKVKKVTKSGFSPDIEFTYDPLGRRISKKVIPKSSASPKVTYYTYDAQGNVLAIYTFAQGTAGIRFTVDEHLVYGSSRLGVRRNGLDLLAYIPSADPVKHPRGLKRYELNNHLGNVHTVVSDRRVRRCPSGSVSHYEADILRTYDYYPFGMNMPGRDFITEICSTYSAITDTTDVSVIADAFDSAYVPNNTASSAVWYRYTTASFANVTGGVLRIAYTGSGAGIRAAARRFTAVSGKTYSLSLTASRVAGAADNTLKIHIVRASDGVTLYSSSNYTLPSTGATVFVSLQGFFTAPDNAEYILVLERPGGNNNAAIIDDLFFSYAEPVYDTLTDCYSDPDAGYRFGFNGQEKDDEVYGEGNSYTAEFWQYDPRTARRWNVDPKPNVSFSPYSINQCNPIWYSDPKGDTVRVKGFSEKYILKELGTGLGTTPEANPFTFNKTGELQVIKDRYDALSTDQQKIVDNIKGTIDSDVTFLLKKEKQTAPIYSDAQGTYTLYNLGGAATVRDPNDPKKVTIYMDGFGLFGSDRPTDKSGNHVEMPSWLTLYHELGGHGFYKYVNQDPKQAGKAIDYENAVRNLHKNMGTRDYDTEHPQ